MMRMAQSTARTTASRQVSRGVKPPQRLYRTQLLWFTAAAAFSTVPTSLSFLHSTSPRPQHNVPLVFPRHEEHPCRPSTARYFSSDKNSGGDNGVLSTITNAAKSMAKSVLPSSWFQTEKERQQAIERQRVRDEVSGSMKELLKDAPLPIRMMGNMIGPLMSSAMSSMAESLAEQQKTVDDYLSQAQMALQSDEAVARLLGDVQVGSPMSQSSSTSSINGKTTTRVEIGFPVTGSRGSGLAQLSATEAGIQRLVLQAQGRQININLSPKGPRSKFSSRRNDDDVIEAEIVDKDTRL